jgi:hypothetical protein
MTEKNNDQEIDILSLFSVVTKKINSLIILIINFFVSILNLFFYIIFIIKKKYLILSISLFIGALIGYVYEKNFCVPKYETTLTLSPNFGSTYQLYETIKSYQNLIEVKDFEKLRIHLNIDSSESKSLLNISIKPYTNELLKLKNYTDLLEYADSITAISFSYEKYKTKFLLK